ncbi:hypothetical protein [Enterococcus faecalis]|nr:hypothetical protein [Enterococcus faecalis]MCU9763603.1 hypothetical protein [Enterococcus faecalis]
MGFKFSDYYNAENICLSEERIRELLVNYFEENGEVLLIDSGLI